MGCMESRKDAGVSFEKSNIGNGAVFAGNDTPTGEEVEVIVNIEQPEVYVAENSEDITIVSKRNDINPIVKEQIISKSTDISKTAIQKLLMRKEIEEETQGIEINNEKLMKSLLKRVSSD